jgi:cytochrome c oxidase cbb3-type subunit 3
LFELSYAHPPGNETINHEVVNEVYNSTNSPLLIFESPYSFSDTVAQVKKAITANNFEFIRKQNIAQTTGSKDKSNVREVTLFFCNFSKLDAALKVDKRIGIFLPCRISIVENNGQVQIISVNPKALNSLFKNQNLETLCNELNQSYIAILEEASL